MTFQEELKEILVQELETLNQLLRLSHEKTEAIMNNELEKIRSLTSKEEKALGDMIKLENTRIKVLDSWGVGIDTPISDVIDKVQDGKEDLVELREEFTQVMEGLREINDLNQRLVKQNLEWVDFNLNILTSTETVGAYGQDSQEREKSTKLFDRKV